MAFYPLVENVHRSGILRRSLAPAPGATPALQETAEGYARRVLERLRYVGVLAIELFQIGDRLLANEMAPRVHNSGHWTIDGAETSQFENHVRAITDMPLGVTAARGAVAMVNLVGGIPEAAAVLAVPGAHLHLYGKEPKPGRKVGHVTLVGRRMPPWPASWPRSSAWRRGESPARRTAVRPPKICLARSHARCYGPGHRRFPMTPIRIAVALACVVAVAVAVAADHPHEARKLSLKERKGRQALSWSVRVPPPVLPAASPVDLGATLEIRSASGESASIALPASGWTAVSSGQVFKFKNRQAPGGLSAVKAATVRNQREIKVTGKGTGVTLDESAQGAVTIALVIGDDVYCSTCTAPRRDEPGRFEATRCPPPADCAVTSTSTTTSTTTSTFVAGVCGNGVVDQPGELCDSSDPGICDETIVGIPLACTAPTSPTPCSCCGTTACFVNPGFTVPCCGSSQCQGTPSVGSTLAGTCIPPSCDEDADCNGYECVDGACCGGLGAPCGVAGCCPGTGGVCTFVEWDLVPHELCCLPAGAPCADELGCCSLSCTAGTCD